MIDSGIEPELFEQTMLTTETNGQTFKSLCVLKVVSCGRIFIFY